MSAIFDPGTIGRVSRSWQPETRQAVVDYLRASRAREDIKHRYSNAADLAQAIDPGYNVTPALKMIADAIEVVLSKPRHNLLVTTPPQEGKSSLCAVFTPLRALQLNPNRRIILATYGDSLAEDHSRACRDLIVRHGSGVVDSMTGVEVADKIGLKLSSSSSKVQSWRIEAARGGMIAVGLGSSITGRAADLFIIDDPYKNMMEADSASHRRRVDEWFASVAQTRLSPEASMILIQTRWHPEDLAGQIIAGESQVEECYRTWRHINIPAISEDGISDSLRRPPGVVMDSARGRTRSEFEQTRRKVGERVWYALYQGSPRNPAGGLFMRSWFDTRLSEPPERTVASVVGVDPADSGEGDETGIVAASLVGDGSVVLTEDWSGHFTADEWARQAVILALTVGAREIAMEAYSAATTYVAVLKRAWKDIQAEAVAKKRSGAKLSDIEVLALPVQMPFYVFKWRGRGTTDAVGRSSLLRQAFETGKCKTVEHKLSIFESEAADWQAGQHQPDRVAAALIAHDRLAALGSGQISMSSPVPIRPVESPAWLKRRIG